MQRLSVVLALVPALALLFLFRWWDKKRPEPAGAVWKVVALGVAACVPAFFAERWLQGALGDLDEAQGGLLHAFLVAGGIEEALKLLVVMLFVWRKDDFNEVMDGVLYLAAASMGFAGLENVYYVMNAAEDMRVTGVVRALTAVPQHAIASGIMGYCVGRAKLALGGMSAPRWIAGGLAAAIGIHGLYDWCLISKGTFGIGAPMPFLGLVEAFAIVVGFGLVLVQLMQHALRLDDDLLGTNSRPTRSKARVYVKP